MGAPGDEDEESLENALGESVVSETPAKDSPSVGAPKDLLEGLGDAKPNVERIVDRPLMQGSEEARATLENAAEEAEDKRRIPAAEDLWEHVIATGEQADLSHRVAREEVVEARVEGVPERELGHEADESALDAEGMTSEKPIKRQTRRRDHSLTSSALFTEIPEDAVGEINDADDQLPNRPLDKAVPDVGVVPERELQNETPSNAESKEAVVKDQKAKPRSRARGQSLTSSALFTEIPEDAVGEINDADDQLPNRPLDKAVPDIGVVPERELQNETPSNAESKEAVVKDQKAKPRSRARGQSLTSSALFTEIPEDAVGEINDADDQLPNRPLDKAVPDIGVVPERELQNETPSNAESKEAVVKDQKAKPRSRARGQSLTSSALFTEIPEDAVGEINDADDQLPNSSLLRPSISSSTKLSDPYYEQLAALRGALVEAGRDANADSIRGVEEQMKDRADQLRADDERAAAARGRMREAMLQQYPFLPKEMHGIALEDLPLRDDDEFTNAEQEHARLAADPARNADALHDAEEQMKDRAAKLADEAAAKEKVLRDQLPFVTVAKVPLRELGLESSPKFVTLRAQYEELAKDPETAHGPEAKRLEKAMDDLAKLLAYDEAAAAQCKAVKEADMHARYPFLPEEPVPGMPLSEAELMADPEFRKLANALDDMRTSPSTTPAALRAAEEQLAERAAQVAGEKLRVAEEAQAQYPFLPKRVAGVLVGDLPLKDDEQFQALMAERAPLLADEEANAEQIRAVEDKLRDRAEELAEQQKRLKALHDAENDELRASNPFLPHNDVRGVPLRELGLPQDADFEDKRLERLRLMQHPDENAAAIQAAEDQLRARAEELAEEKLRAEEEELARHPFLVKPAAAPLLTTLGVPQDEQFQELATQHASLAEDPVRNAEQLRAVEEAMQDRVDALAAKDAEAALKPAKVARELVLSNPMCAPYVHPAVPTDATFNELATLRDELLCDPEANAAPLRAVEEDMHHRAVEVAAKQRRRTRPERLGASMEISIVESEEAGELKEDEADVVPKLSGTEVRDPYYEQLAALRDALVEAGRDANADSIRGVEEQMKDRADQLRADDERAAAARGRMREAMLQQYPFLPKEMHGIALEDLPLRDDDEFTNAEQEHARLAADPARNADALHDAEEQMKDRAAKLADEAAAKEKVLRDQLPFVTVAKVPLRELGLESSPKFVTLRAQYEELAKDPETAHGPEAKRLEKAIGELARRVAEDEAERTRHELLDAEGLHERYPFLPEEPARGVSLVSAGVLEDPEFRTLANALDDMRTSPSTTPAALRAAEEQLAERAAQVAGEKLRVAEEAQAQYPFLPKRVAGVLVGDLPLKDDEQFQALMAERAPLLGSPRANAAKLRAIEEAAKARVRELAVEKNNVDGLRMAADDEVRARSPFLPHNDVRGVPLRELALSRDPEYANLTDRRLELMQHPLESAEESAAVEARLKERAAEVANAKLAEEDELRATYPTVVTAPGAAMLSSLFLPLDPCLAKLAQQRAALAAQPSPDAAALRAVDEAAAVRVQELVDEDAKAEREAAQARAAVLKLYPMCARDVTEAVGKDAMFASLAARHTGLLSDPEANATPLDDVEDLMRERGVEVESGRRRRRRPANPPRLLDINDVALEDGEVDDYHSRRQRHRRGRILDAREVPAEEAGEVREQPEDKTLPPKSRHVAALRKNDPYYQELVALRDALVAEDEAANVDAIRCVEEQMRDRAQQLSDDAARARAAEMRAEAALQAHYPFLGPTVTGEMLTAVGLEDDKAFAALAAQHATLKATPTASRQAVADVEQKMRARASELVAQHARDEEALTALMPFVGTLPGGVTLRELDIANDPDVKPLLAQLEELAKDPETAHGPEAKRLEKAIGELARRVAEDEAERTRHELLDAEGLHERYPFLPEEPARGVSLVSAGVLEDPEFRTLANALDDMRRDPEPKESAVKVMERSLTDVARRLGEAKVNAAEEAQAQYPFLPKRVAGVLVGDLPLKDDEQFQALMAERAPLLGSPRTNASRLTIVETLARERARELAENVKAVELFHIDEDEALRARHPFLRYSDVSLIPLREVGIELDPEVERLARRRLRLRGAATVEFAAVEQVEGELRERVAELAGRVVAAEMKGRRRFLPRQRRTAGVVFTALHIPDDEEIVEWRLDVMENPDCDDDDEAVAKKAMRRRGSMLLDAYLVAEADVATELHRLRRANPICVRDVNPSVELDDYLTTLRSAYADWAAFMDEEEPTLMQLEDDIRTRSVALIGDDRCVADALNDYCAAEAELRLANAHRQPASHIARLRFMTDVALYKHRLWSRRQARRRVLATVFDIPDNEGDFIADDGADSWTDEDTYAAHARTAHAKAAKDSYFLFLQRQKAMFIAAGHSSGARCVSELLKRRLRQLTTDAARLQRSRQRCRNATLKRFPFLQTRYMSAPLPELRLDEDDDFMRLAAEREQLLKPPSELRDRYPFLPAVIDGVPIEELGLESDAEFMRLASQREDLIGPLRAKLKGVLDREEAMRVRMSERVAAYIAEENAQRVKYHFVDIQRLPVSLQQLCLEYDVPFMTMYAEYMKGRLNSATEDSSVLSSPKAGQRSRLSSTASMSTTLSQRPHVKTAARKKLEKEMRDWVMRRAEEEAAWEASKMMELESLADRFPFLPVEPIFGVHLGEVGALQDAVFCDLAAEVERAQKNLAPAEDIAAAEKALATHVLKLAEAKRDESTRRRRRCPHLPQRVAGVLVSDIELPTSVDIFENDAERALLAYHDAAAQMKGRRVCGAEEDEAVRSRHPFLEMNDIHGVPLRQLALADDPIFMSYLSKWRKVLSKETIDREKLRIYEDVLRERAEEQALRIVDVNAAMVGRLRALQLGDVLPLEIPLLDMHNELVRDRDAMVAEHANGQVPPATAEDRALVTTMSAAYATAAAELQAELTTLRHRYPWSVRDVNPALDHDDAFQQLEQQRQSLLASSYQVDTMESIEKEERKRSVELIEDKAYVDEAAAACAAAAQKPLRRLSSDELTSRWKYQLRLDHHRRRIVTFEDIPDDGGQTSEAAAASNMKRRKSRERKKHGMSWSKLDIDAVPDNVFMEIKEDEFHTSLAGSLQLSESPGALEVVSPAVPPTLESGHSGAAPGQPQRQRRSAGQRQRLGSVTAESVPVMEASAMLEDGRIVPVDALEKSGASSTVETSQRQQSEAVVSSSDVSGVSPQGGESLPATGRKTKKLVLKKRPRARRPSMTSMSAIPDMDHGELVEQDLDEIDSVVSTVSERGGGDQARTASPRIPQRPLAQRRKVPVKPGPAKPRLAARGIKSAAPASSRATPEPLVTKKARKRGTSRLGTQPLTAAGEAPEVTVGLLNEQQSEQQPQVDDAGAALAPSRAAMAAGPKLELEDQQLREPAERASSAAKKRRRVVRPSSVPRSRVNISKLQEEQAGEIVAAEHEERLQDPPPSSASVTHTESSDAKKGGRNASAAKTRKTPSRGASARASATAAVSPVLSAPTKYPMYSLAAVVPADGPEAAELTQQEAYVREVMVALQPTLARPLTVEEVEAAPLPMSYVFEHYDLGAYAAATNQSSALLEARQLELETALKAWMVQRATTPLEPAEQRATNIQRVRQERRRLVATRRDPVENPRDVPLRWARLTAEELDQDAGLRQLMDSAASQARIADYLAAWSTRKQAANETLFARFPFLPTLASGYALTEIGFTNDPDFQRYTRGGAYLESVHVQQQLHDVVERLARAKVAAAEGRCATRFVDRVRMTVETTRDPAASAEKSTNASGAAPAGGDLTQLVKDAQALMEQPEDRQLLDAINAAREKRSSKFLDKRKRLAFIAQSKQDAERLIKRMMIRMKKEKTPDIPLSMEDVEALRGFFDGVDLDHFGVLDRTDATDFIMITLGESKRMSRADVEKLLFPDVPRGTPLPTLVDFSDFSKFYKAVALQDLVKQDFSFDQQNVVARAAANLQGGGAGSGAAAAAAVPRGTSPRRPEPPAASARAGGTAGGRRSRAFVPLAAPPTTSFAAVASATAPSERRLMAVPNQATSSSGPTRGQPGQPLEPRRPTSEPRTHAETNGANAAAGSSSNNGGDIAAASAPAAPGRWLVNGRPTSGHSHTSN
ncbi:tb-292 membrane associated protein-like protein [Lotmaria passim]